MSDIAISSAGAVMTIRINRPHKKNAFTAAMYADMADGLIAAHADAGTRAILFLGAPGIFSAGNDMMDFLAAATKGALSDEVLRFLRGLATSTKPLVAGVDGWAVGVGTTMLLHCDHVVASTGAKFQTPFVNLGLVPEAGSSLIAPRIMGHHRAFALLAMGRVFSPEDAMAAGFVNEVVSPDALEARASAIAAEIAALPAEGLAQSRALMRGHPADVLARIDEEAELFKARLKSAEARAAFEAFLTKKKA
jgi:enoyl-CoA hydratase/carnithine racemase